jgi:hypothetical protein
MNSLARSAIIVRFRKLPAHILKAEQGIDAALQAFRSSR